MKYKVLPHILLAIQNVIHFLWVKLEFRKERVWSPNDRRSNKEGWFMKDKSCPIIYYRRGSDSIAIGLYFMFGGFYVGHSAKGDMLYFKK